MHWLIDELTVFLVSVFVTGIIIPQILLIAFRKKLFDEPDGRKIHTAAVPRLGGMAFMPAILFSLCLVVGVDVLVSMNLHGWEGAGSVVMMLMDGDSGRVMLPLLFGMCSLLIMYLVGLADDLIGVRYRAKFVAQIVAALLLAAGGVRLDSLHGMLGISEMPWPAAWFVTTLLVVFIMNAINLIDGIDGLASGLSAIAMGFYGFVFMLAGEWINAMVAFATLGALVQFFYYNVFGNAKVGKKIFMGDTGSLTIGVILAYLSLEVCCISHDGIFKADVLVVAFAPLAIPCLDVLRVFCHRILRGKSPFLPDKVHIHHKFLAMGVPQRVAMILIVVGSGVLIGLDLWLSWYVGAFWVLVIDLVMWVIFNWWLTRAIYDRQKRMGITDGYN